MYIRVSFVECTEALYHDTPDIQNSAEIGDLAANMSVSLASIDKSTVPRVVHCVQSYIVQYGNQGAPLLELSLRCTVTTGNAFIVLLSLITENKV